MDSMMSENAFFDALDEVFGTNDGYIHHLERIKKMKEENEKWTHWASEVIHWSHSSSLDNIQAKKLITDDNQPTIASVRDFGKEISELKKRLEDAEHEAESWEDSFNELKEENEKLKEELENETSAEGLDELIIHNLKEENEKLKDKVFCYDLQRVSTRVLKEEIEKLKEENEKWKYWASEVIHWSHSGSKDNLQAKKLITDDNKPTIADVRDFGAEIKELKETIEEMRENKIHPYTGDIIQTSDITNLQKEIYKLKEENKKLKAFQEEKRKALNDALEELKFNYATSFQPVNE